MTEAVAILVDRAPGQIRAAAVDAGGTLLDLAIERPGGAPDVGDVHRGRVGAARPSLGGAFVTLSQGEGFLPDSAGARGLGEGAAVVVRVVRAPQGGKGPRLAAAAYSGGKPDSVGLLSRGPGAVARLAALFAGATLREGWTADLAEQVAALAEPQVDLPGGGRMTITSTPALVAIDVDLASLASGRGGKAHAHMRANAAWIPELARHIRLRNLGGGIVVDFAGLSARRRGALGPALAEALVTDPLQPRLLGFTALGFAEILRPRGHAPLHELLAGPHAAALAAARALAREAAADPARRVRLRASPALAAAFALDGVLQDDLRDRLGEKAAARADPALSGLQWELEN